MKRKLCALLLALGMIVSFAAAAGAAAFADVPGGSWSAAGVSLAAEKGIMTGTGETTFSPRRLVSWAQAITIAARLHAQNTGKSVPAADEEEAWYAPALAYAKTNALLPPDCPEDEAALTGPLSRRSLAYLLAKHAAALADHQRRAADGYRRFLPTNRRPSAPLRPAASWLANPADCLTRRAVPRGQSSP
ncbi:MAG: S-layer homology domain-containing protein [Oscillospiraceae bacterium]